MSVLDYVFPTGNRCGNTSLKKEEITSSDSYGEQKHGCSRSLAYYIDFLFCAVDQIKEAAGERTECRDDSPVKEDFRTGIGAHGRPANGRHELRPTEVPWGDRDDADDDHDRRNRRQRDEARHDSADDTVEDEKP